MAVTSRVSTLTSLPKSRPLSERPANACKSFGWREPRAALDWSWAEEIARQVVLTGQNDIEGARITLPQYVRGTTTWLSILYELERPLKFDTLLGSGIEYAGDGRTSVRTTGNNSSTCTAVASIYVMDSGIHYAEFQITAGYPFIGVVRPISNLDPDRFADSSFQFFGERWYDDFLAARSDEWGDGDVHACEYVSYNGYMSWTNWEGEEDDAIEWDGMEGCKAGNTVGMLLNLDEGTLTVFKNNRRLGVMRDGFSGSYCWYATAIGYSDSSVSIKRGEPPRA